MSSNCKYCTGFLWPIMQYSFEVVNLSEKENKNGFLSGKTWEVVFPFFFKHLQTENVLNFLSLWNSFHHMLHICIKYFRRFFFLLLLLNVSIPFYPRCIKLPVSLLENLLDACHLWMVYIWGHYNSWSGIFFSQQTHRPCVYVFSKPLTVVHSNKRVKRSCNWWSNAGVEMCL